MKNKRLQAKLMLLPFFILYITLCYHSEVARVMTIFFGGVFLFLGSLALFIMGINYLTFGIWVFPMRRGDNSKQIDSESCPRVD